jgi:uncharacterized protein (DUF2126 family)/transglutaminase-like putative cysteine protease
VVAVQVVVEHRTTYHFDRPVTLGPHLVRLRPAPHTRTPIRSYSLDVAPAQHFVNWQQDPFGNHVARLVFPEPVTYLDVTVNLVADLTVINPFDFFVEEYAERFPFAYDAELARALEVYRTPGEQPGPLLRQWLAALPQVGPDGMAIVEFLAMLNRQAANTVGYTVRLEEGVQTPEQTLALAIGSCRDSAWLLVTALRELGLAARFVSGYLIQLAPDVPDGPHTITSDFTDLHAWAEVFLPGAGWVGLDATSGLFAGEGHIPLAATPQPSAAAPITGRLGPAVTTMEFSNTVTRLHEDPRTTKPYTDEQWQRVLELGDGIDRRLEAGDVRLTMGGEPTFVAADDMESPQWSIDADGPEKRERATTLAAQLKQHYAPDGIIAHGQGKWYPGEALPRWQLAITWRADGQPLWRDPLLLADPWGPAEFDDGLGRRQASALIRRIAAGLGIADTYVLPVYEDKLVALADEARLPEGDPPLHDVDPEDDSFAGGDKRAHLVKRLDADRGTPTGWVVPVHRTEDGEHWATTTWRTRRGRIILLPGTSPVGLRLPLSSIAWEPAQARPESVPFTMPEPLGTVTSAGQVPPAHVTSVADAPPTALAVEPRNGHLFVFLPPIDDLSVALELLGAIEAAATEQGTPVVLEGYPLPGDPRTRTLTVTPDPGVIEVNVQPASSWRELVEINENLADAATRCGLATQKFALDGAHAGTGGGSHLTLGGAAPADSPLLRRPDLLVSMLTFWQHHPALSYLFSGRFIGPTSQAPRVDEARHEYLYELEIAFAELDRLGDKARPWAVDRALRHLLTDLTGNTHRAEFCIDKLFSPDSARGRLGLLELRGFEMPPHVRMSLVQALLVRSLVARFWDERYQAPLVRWGMGLHDRFLLPAFVAADIADVVADLRAHGIEFDAEWLEPFLQFRFPVLGAATIGPVELELRAGIEPWHVLGEEAAGSGTARYVDSSLERLQLRVEGATPGRHVITCNAVAVPLHPMPGGTGLVAGIRYRAWAPPSALHPTIGVHSPLVFEVIDSWSGRALGGCTYHVVHPGGRAYDRFPVNANEAEARRAARFHLGGHVAGSETAVLAPVSSQPPVSSELPVTLDLRRVGGSAR